MPSYIVKCIPEADFYVLWSAIADAPIMWGARADLEGRYDMTADRFDRADKWGCSAMPNLYRWDDSGFVYLQQGYLPREKLLDLCVRLERDEPVDDLLEPLED